jgi:hypothetical protein
MAKKASRETYATIGIEWITLPHIDVLAATFDTRRVDIAGL